MSFLLQITAQIPMMSNFHRLLLQVALRVTNARKFSLCVPSFKGMFVSSMRYVGCVEGTFKQIFATRNMSLKCGPPFCCSVTWNAASAVRSVPQEGLSAATSRANTRRETPMQTPMSAPFAESGSFIEVFCCATWTRIESSHNYPALSLAAEVRSPANQI